MTQQDPNPHVAHSVAFDRRDLSMATPSTNGFTQIWNALILDGRLTATAFRIAAYLCSKPEDWTAREHDIRNALGLGHDAYLAAMRQLVDVGYVTRGMTTRERAHQDRGPSACASAGCAEVGSTDSGSPDSCSPTCYQY
jgi:hypothetical protein